MPYDFEPQFLGEHVRKRRLERGQTQKEAAVELGVNSWTVLNWERGHTEPPIASIPSILKYQGYDPFPEPNTLQECLFAKRREMGWPIKEAAESIGVDPSTWGNWERGQLILFRKHRGFVARLLDLSEKEFDREMAKRWGSLHECTRLKR